MPVAKHGIFRKQRLRPTQLRAIADRRWDDARCLMQSGQNARANGAMYLGGFVIECLLKANLLITYPWLGTATGTERLHSRDRALWSLCYRSHDLDEILARLPNLEKRLAALEQRGLGRVRQALKRICAEWSIYARYSPHSATCAEAGKFLERIQEVRPWLR